MPENSVVPSRDDVRTPTHVPAKAHVVPLDPSSTTVSPFLSEQVIHEGNAPKPDAEIASVLPADRAPRAASDFAEAGRGAPTENAPRRSLGTLVTARGAVVALLVLAVVAQGGYIGYRMFWGNPMAIPPETGTLSVTSEPSGAAVLIDGTARGTTPVQLTLAPGTHTVEVGTGPQSRSQSVAVTRGGTFSLHQGLAAQPAAGLVAGTGGLQIATEPVGARVWIDGAPQGVAPVTVLNLKVGDHLVTVRGPSGDPVNRTVSVQEAAVASLVVSMIAPAGIASGWLALSSSIPLQIREKGTVIGTTETPRILLPTGAHELELVNAELGYRATQTVQIAAGQTASIALKAPMGAISINAVPWAEVWIDGRPAGETPIGNLSIEIGKHELLFRHPELGEQRRSVTVGVTSPVRVSADMRKK